MKDVKELQIKLQNHAVSAQQVLETTIIDLMNKRKLVEDTDNSQENSEVTEDTIVEEDKKITTILHLITEFTIQQSELTISEWSNLLYILITKYHDGYMSNSLENPANIVMKKLFYPKWWLDATGFFNNKPNTGEGVIMFSSNPNSTSGKFKLIVMYCDPFLFRSFHFSH